MEAAKKNDSFEKKVSLEKLLEFHIAPSNIFWLKKDGKKTLLRSRGAPIDYFFFKKFGEKGYEFVIEDYRYAEKLSGCIDLFKELKNTQLESDRWPIRNKLLSWFLDNYLKENTDFSILDLMIVGSSCLSQIDYELEAFLIENSLNNYYRGCLAGSLSVFFSLSLGFLDYHLLEDIFNICLVQDISLVGNDKKKTLFLALENERLKDNGLQDSIENEQYRQVILSHVTNYEEMLSNYKSFLNQNESHNLIELHHEKMNGKGFPHGFSSDELGDFELIYILVNIILPFEEIKFQDRDGYRKVSNYMKLGNRLNPELRILKNIFKAIDDVEN